MSDDQPTRRSFLAGAGVSLGAMLGYAGVDVTTARPPDELVRRRVPFVELSFSADVDPESMTAPPMVGCRRRKPAVREGGTVHLARGASVRRGSPLMATHEGTKTPTERTVTFHKLPIEATTGGHALTIHRSSAPTVELETTSGEARVSVAGERLTVASGDSGTASTTVEVGTDALDVDTAPVEVQAKYHGVDDVLSHPDRTVVPRNRETREMMDALSERRGREGNGPWNGQGRGRRGRDTDRGRRVPVTEVPDEDCYLVGPPERRGR